MTTPTLNYATLPNGEGNGAKVRNVFGHLCAVFVTCVFCYAAIEKIIGVQQFAVMIGNYKMPWIAEKYLNIPAILIPWIELAAAIALLFPRTRKGAAVVICGMLLFFIYAVYDAAVLRELKIECGCFGKDSRAAGWMTIGEDVLFLAATILSVKLPACMSSRAAARKEPAPEADPVAEPA